MAVATYVGTVASVCAGLLALGIAVTTRAAPPAGRVQVCESVLLAAADAYRAGDGAGSLRHLSPGVEAVCPSPTAGEIRYLRARVQLASGDLEAAVVSDGSQFAGVPSEVIADWRRRRGLALASLGQCRAAIEALSPLERLGGSRDAAIPLARARCQMQLGDPAAAAQDFALARRWDGRRGDIDRAAVGLQHAQALQRAGRDGEARQLAREVALAYPAYGGLSAVEQLRGALGDSTAFSYGEGLTRAKNLVVAKDFTGAAKAFAGLELPQAKAARAAHLHHWGKALFRSRADYGQAATILSRAARLGGPFAQEDGFLAARALARADKDRKAVAAFDRFIQRYRRGPWVSKASYLAAWLSLRHGFRGGRRRMLRFIDGRLGRGRNERNEGMFLLAIDDLAHRRFRAAERMFTRYASTGSGPMDRGRGLYWAARSALGRGRRRVAVKLLTEVRTQYPRHYYAQLAEQRLAQLGKPCKQWPPALPKAASEPVRALPLPSLVAFYSRLGLVEDAQQHLRRSGAARRTGGSGLGGRLPLALAYANLGAAHRASKVLSPALAQAQAAPRSASGSAALSLAYARPYGEHVLRHAERWSIDPDLLYAIMRKESSFDTHAHSYADAMGLLQLLPDTAQHVAERLGQPFSRADLFRPDRNIALGAAYLAGLLEQFPQHPALAIAAYNAGGHQVQAWLDRVRQGKGKPVQLDLFVEAIPIVQTRNYVRRVLTNWAWYRYLDGETGPVPHGPSWP